MKKAILIATICLLVVMVVSAAANASDTKWRIILQTVSGTTNNAGNIYIGAVSESTDFKDANDAFLPSLMDPYIALYEMRNDWEGGSKLKSDMRAPYTNATKVWSNWFIFSNMANIDGDGNPAYITLSWDPGTDEYALPTGDYKMYVTWSAGVMADDSSELGGTTSEIDLSQAGSINFQPTDQNNVQASVRIVCKVGNGPALFKAGAYTTTGTGTMAINCAPVVDENGYAYFGSDNTKIFKVNTTLDPMTSATLTAPTGSIKGRMANYGNFVYGIGHTGSLNKRAKTGTTGNWAKAIAANAGTVPAVLSDGSIYVGSGNFVKKLDANGNVIATSPDLGGPVGSPAIPGTDLVWVNAGNKIVCLFSNLATARATFDAGAPVSAPAALRSIVVATAGDKILTLGSTGLDLKSARTVGGAIGGSAFVTPDSKVLFAAADHKLYAADPFAFLTAPNAGAFLGNGSGVISGSPVVGATWTAVAGGDDYTVYLVNNQTGEGTYIGVNQSTLGCVTDLSGHIYFTSSDGNLYVVE